MFISASKDTSAKLFDVDSLECHKTYQTERPVNSAAISPTRDHVRVNVVIKRMQGFSIVLMVLRHTIFVLLNLKISSCVNF